MKIKKNIFSIAAIFFITSICVEFMSCVSSDFYLPQDSAAQNQNQQNQIPQDKNQIESENQNVTIITQEKILEPEFLEEQNSFLSTIILKTDAPKANVYINNIYQGKTPLKIENFQPGFYSLKIDFSSAQNLQNSNNLQSEFEKNNLSENQNLKKIIKNFMIEIQPNKIFHYYIEK